MRGFYGFLALALPMVLAAALLALTAGRPEAMPGLDGARPAAAAPLLLAQSRDDASAPVFQDPVPRRRSADPVVSIPPFALPTAPIVSAPPESQDGETVPPPEAAAAPPYEGEALRLSELLGSLHYLRPLCGARDGLVWREQMERLVATSPSNEQWRARLVHSFNRGYRAFERTYRSCTPPAAQAVGLYMTEGHELVQLIKTRYGD